MWTFVVAKFENLIMFRLLGISPTVVEKIHDLMSLHEKSKKSMKVWDVGISSKRITIWIFRDRHLVSQLKYKVYENLVKT